MKQLELVAWVVLIIAAAWALGDVAMSAMAESFIVGWALLVLGVIIGVAFLVFIVGWDTLTAWMLRKYAPKTWYSIDGTKHEESPSVKDENQANAEVDALEFLFHLNGPKDEEK